MTTRATFAFIREGTSDDGLIPHLSDLLIRAGFDEALGAPRDYRGRMVECLERVQSEEVPVDIIFVHRDSDHPSDNERRIEAAGAIASLGTNLTAAVVPVVPIQELEAWLLLDESEIRAVAGKPSKKTELDLPKHAQIQSKSSPKEVLQVALLVASDTKGRRRKEAKRRFPDHRRTLLERLNIDGPVRQLGAWQTLERDVAEAAATVLAKYGVEVGADGMSDVALVAPKDAREVDGSGRRE